MAHIYLTFDFAGNEEKAQQARHKLDSWKQAFRLDKKLLYKFDRGDGASGAASEPQAAEEPEKPAAKGKGAKAGKAAKPKATKKEGEKVAAATQAKLYLRLAFSNHEKLTEQRWVDRIPAEEPFKEASPAAIREGEPGFDEVEGHFEELD